MHAWKCCDGLGRDEKDAVEEMYHSTGEGEVRREEERKAQRIGTKEHDTAEIDPYHALPKNFRDNLRN